MSFLLRALNAHALVVAGEVVGLDDADGEDVLLASVVVDAQRERLPPLPMTTSPPPFPDEVAQHDPRGDAKTSALASSRMTTSWLRSFPIRRGEIFQARRVLLPMRQDPYASQ